MVADCADLNEGPKTPNNDAEVLGRCMRDLGQIVPAQHQESLVIPGRRDNTWLHNECHLRRRNWCSLRLENRHILCLRHCAFAKLNVQFRLDCLAARRRGERARGCLGRGVAAGNKAPAADRRHNRRDGLHDKQPSPTTRGRRGGASRHRERGFEGRRRRRNGRRCRQWRPWASEVVGHTGQPMATLGRGTKLSAPTEV